MFETKDIAEYYNTTQNHYLRWWDLARSYSLHYGIWDSSTKNFTEAAINTNKVMMQVAAIKENDRVLDAGCGVGGAAIFLGEKMNAKVTGITLSQKQIDFATNLAKTKGLDGSVDFQLMDYTRTNFPNESFDVIWACESVSSCPEPSLFINEAYRLLKKGGKLILSDCFLTNENQKDPRNWIKKWGATWAVSSLNTSQTFERKLGETGFSNTQILDYTKDIEKSAKRMYYACVLGMLPSELYNVFYPNASRFARHHYRSGIYQYRALKKDLWRYKIILSVKNA